MISPAHPSSDLLQPRLDDITAHTRSLVPAERLARTEQIVAELQRSGIEENKLPPGAPLPSFALTAATGKLVRSADVVALGPLVLKFFRGRWDPYDMTELEACQALQPSLRGCRALMVAISPQTPRQNAFTAERHHLSFPILTDPGCAFAEQLRLAYTVLEAMRPYFRSMLVNIPVLNGDDSWRLPLPATYVIGASGTVVSAEGFADHRRRPEPAAALATLENILQAPLLKAPSGYAGPAR